MVIRYRSELYKLVKILESGFAFDTETSSLDVTTKNLVGLSFANDKVSAFIPVGFTPVTSRLDFSERDLTQIPVDEVMKILEPLFSNPDILKVAHNLKFDMGVISNYGVDVRGLENRNVFDTMLAAFLIDENRPVGLKDLTETLLGVKQTTFKELTSDGRRLAELDIDTVASYAIADAVYTWKLYKLFLPQLAEEGVDGVFYKVDMPVVKILLKMFQQGITVDCDERTILENGIDTDIKGLTSSVYASAGLVFNIRSTAQLGKVLFEHMKLPVVERTNTGKYATNEAVLEKLANGGHDIAIALNELRKLEKLQGTYVRGLIPHIYPDGKVRAQFNQTVARTGRLSSSEPNMQNIPKVCSHNIRNLYIAAPGCKLICADYSQIEIRVMAHMSEDPILLNAFLENKDVYLSTASNILGKPIEEITKAERQIFKSITLGMNYGMGPDKLAETLKISKQDAKYYMAEYFRVHKQIKFYHEWTKKFLYKYGFVRTITGRKRRFNNLPEDQMWQAERQAVNARIQGSAADIMKIGMINVYREIHKTDARLLLQVHDEIEVEVPEKEAEKYSKIIRTCLESAMELRIPLLVDMRIVDKWGQNE